ncbi:FixH family protein [Robertmurraya andreesenii]|uniref:YtkA-like domain-containing protein n=1 Tax=Anoxybacillus andreesenii TaxID=1325932 RepID=A0ABT9V294_9BACL|nr:FixH family protein [Robertmurraya andreesenii]MDQ0155076.1 hypothetical protein [Robertmurraya andreesenii]
MKKFLFILVFLLGVGFMAACSDKDKDKGEAEPQFIDVKLTVHPEKGEAGEPVTIEAKVTYGDEEVKDADVQFEIWRAHDEHHEKVKIEHAEKGIYRLEKSFEQEGTYYVVSHVTAKEMHNMPKKEFVIGEASEPEDASSSSHMNMDEEHGDHNDNEH